MTTNPEYFTRDELIARKGAKWVAEHLGPKLDTTILDSIPTTALELEQANDRDREEITMIVNLSQALTVAATDLELTVGRMKAQIEDLAGRYETLTRQIGERNDARLAVAMRDVAASAADSRSVAQRYLDGDPSS